jgi:hypothetical protein
MKFRIVTAAIDVKNEATLLENQATELKSGLLKLQEKVASDNEKNKVMDDALSACDLLVHHLQDLKED